MQLDDCTQSLAQSNVVTFDKCDICQERPAMFEAEDGTVVCEECAAFFTTLDNEED